MTDLLLTIKSLIQNRYCKAKAVFGGGSVYKNKGTEGSDLDLVIVFDFVSQAYREAFIYNNWPIDAFIHDTDTLKYFFENIEKLDGKPALMNMIVEGYDVLKSDFSKNIQCMAKEILNLGTKQWTQEQIDRQRFFITDILDDIKFSQNTLEKMASASSLLEPLIQFYFRAKNKWTASGKTLIQYLEKDNPSLALEVDEAFKKLFQNEDSSSLECLIKKILAPYGGPLWHGFKSNAPQEWKKINEKDDNKSILEELKSREPIFHHPKKFGKNEENILNQMCDDFWEVGASGKTYLKSDVLKTLLTRYKNQKHQDIYKISNFKLHKINSHSYLLTYNLVQNKTRKTKRLTIWQKTNGQWKVLYHQGTIVKNG